MASSSKRKVLTLKEKVAVLDYVKKNPSAASRKISGVFGCGKTQIQSILNNKQSIMDEYEANGQESRKRHRVGDFQDVNDAVYKWYCLARERNIPITGPLLKEEALLIAKKLDPSSTFKASNGWLESFKKRHNIKHMTVSGECGDVPEETVTGWFERIVVLTTGYKPEDVWNTDETGCFYRALPDKTLSDKKKECRGGKKAKERLTISFFANAAGEKEPPIIIGKSASPRCFKGLRDKATPHGLPYFSNKKAWMNMDIMDAILIKLNRRMVRERRNIILLMDNVSSHSPDLKEKFSNIKVVFLPVNTTSRLQPLDAGIIKNFKVHYRRLLVKHTLAKINDASGEVMNASSICKSVNVLLAIRWIKEAWEAVTANTIQNCFRRCGAIPRASHESENDSEDPFNDLDVQTQDIANLNELVQQMGCGITGEQYVTDEEDLTTCYSFDGASEGNWRERMRADVCSNAAKRPALDGNESTCSEEEEEEPEVSSITSVDVAMLLSKDLLLFLLDKGQEQAAEYQQKIISTLQDVKLNNKKSQSTIMDYIL